MKILAVDTSAAVAGVAVMSDGVLLGEYFLNHKKTHSVKLMPMVEMLMRDLEIKPADIDVYAASIGPGSFTGLRIGVTAVKAMAYAAGKPVAGVPSLDALAFNITADGALICPIMDARNNQVYTALYVKEKDALTNISGYMGVPVSELAGIIKSKNSKAVFVGDAAGIHRDFLMSELGERCEFAPSNLLLQRASSVAQLAHIKAVNGELQSCFEMVPFYLRKSQAEREYERTQLSKG